MNKVLIIDDDKELCALIKRSVLSEDIEADFCNTGKEGLQKLKEREYQLVILDVTLTKVFYFLSCLLFFIPFLTGAYWERLGHL